MQYFPGVIGEDLDSRLQLLHKMNAIITEIMQT